MARSRTTLGELSRPQKSYFLKHVFVLILTIIIGVLFSVSVNAQSTAAKKSETKKARTYKKSKNRSRPNFYALNNAVTGQRALIREIVSQHLSEETANKPFELAPIVFRQEGQAMVMVDQNTFLIALEFALQGKTIVIGNESVITPHEKLFQKQLMVDTVVSKMVAMGVSQGSIRIGEIVGGQALKETETELALRLAAL